MIEQEVNFEKGQRVGGFVIRTLIGSGGFGKIYKVSAPGARNDFAMKVEPLDPRYNDLDNERKILQAMNNTFYAPRFVKYGRTEKFEFLVMSLGGPSLHSLMKNSAKKFFPLSTALRLGIETLKCIEALHKSGYIHRDIKPANFLIRANKKFPVNIIDFGLSKEYPDLKVINNRGPNVKHQFVGSVRYASVYSLTGVELSRRDDVISWYYTLLELMTGSLPWVGYSKREDVLRLKKAFNVRLFLRGLPIQLFKIWDCIMQYRLDDRPDYQLLISFLQEAMDDNGFSWNEPYSWEVVNTGPVRPVRPPPTRPPPPARERPSSVPEVVRRRVSPSERVERAGRYVLMFLEKYVFCC